MKPYVVSIVAAAAMVASASALASAGLQLAQKSGCLACHAVDHKVLGPAYRDVAKKYHGVKGAEAKLIKKVEKGGSGVWGSMPMPPNAPRVSDANIKKLVEWILAGAK